ncbi:MAG: hypothetical protein AB7U82_27605 [Blastocatellales bacterium]
MANQTNFGNLAAKTLQLNGTSLTVTAAELNKNAGVTAGVASASKAAVLGANKELAGQARPVLIKNDNATILAADSGAIVIITAADKVMSLPATAPGAWYTFVLAAAGLSVGTGLAISPVAADKIMGNGFTSADNKDALLAGSGDREGDSITIVADGVDGWYIVSHEGAWTREA